MDYLEVGELVGKTLTEIKNEGNELIFIVDDGTKYKMYHEQDCCENVGLEEVIGDLDDLIGSPILMAEEVSNSDYENKWLADMSEEERGYLDSYTWTFYKFATIKGYVDLRWLGESNGWYSESVDFIKIK